MNSEVLDRWCQRGILALVLAILVFGPLAFGGWRPSEFLVIQGLTVGVMLLWGVRIWLNRRPNLLWPPICWAVLAFALYAVARYLTADIEYVARQELIRVLVYVFLFFAVLNNLHSQDSTQIISFTLIFLAMVISCHAVYQFLTGSTRVWNLIVDNGHRASGTYTSPNHLAGFLEQLLPLGIAYALTGRSRPVVKVLLGYAALVALAGILVTQSRGSWLSSGLALFPFFGVLASHRRHRLPALTALIVVAGAAFWLIGRSYMLQFRLKSLPAEVQGAEYATRVAIWRSTIRMWQDHFWWGGGPGHFDYLFRSYRPETVQMRANKAHNDYLNTLADWGVAGAVPVFSACLLLALGAVRSWRAVRITPSDLGGKRGSNKSAFVLGASFGLLALAIHSLVDFNMQIPANAILAVSLIALLSAHLRFATDRDWSGMGVWAKLLASALLVAGLGYLGTQTWRHAREVALLHRAARSPEFSAQRAEWLTKAFAAEPMNPATAGEIGEIYRNQSLRGGLNYRELAGRAMEWFARGMKLNPIDPYSFLRYAMCLDWLGRSSDSAPYFDRADQLDPNGYFTTAHIGLHYVELGDYAAAKPWLERSLRLQGPTNTVAAAYLQLVNSRMLEAATNDLSSRLNLPR